MSDVASADGDHDSGIRQVRPDHQVLRDHASKAGRAGSDHDRSAVQELARTQAGLASRVSGPEHQASALASIAANGQSDQDAAEQWAALPVDRRASAAVLGQEPAVPQAASRAAALALSAEQQSSAGWEISERDAVEARSAFPVRASGAAFPVSSSQPDGVHPAAEPDRAGTPEATAAVVPKAPGRAGMWVSSCPEALDAQVPRAVAPAFLERSVPPEAQVARVLPAVPEPGAAEEPLALLAPAMAPLAHGSTTAAASTADACAQAWLALPDWKLPQSVSQRQPRVLEGAVQQQKMAQEIRFGLVPRLPPRHACRRAIQGRRQLHDPKQ
jgi:hypothetical protein